jgi:hypothetical protein
VRVWRGGSYAASPRPTMCARTSARCGSRMCPARASRHVGRGSAVRRGRTVDARVVQDFGPRSRRVRCVIKAQGEESLVARVGE